MAIATVPWSLRRLTGPAVFPISVNEVRTNLNLPTGAATPKDTIIEQQIASATEQVERDTDRMIITQTYELAGQEFPRRNEAIDLKIRPIQSIESIEYLDDDGTSQAMPEEDYKLDQNRRHAYLAIDKTWPDARKYRNSIRISFTAGFGDTAADVPPMIKRAIHLQVGRWFFDPSMEDKTDDGAYERIIQKIIRTGYP